MNYLATTSGTTVVAIAPGRVNLVGEHTDYSGGLVLPMAIPFTTRATITPVAGNHYNFSSNSFDTVRSLHRDDRSAKIGDWSDYPVGVLRELQRLGIDPAPFHLALDGNVPLGAGLSSSASVEVASALAMLNHARATMTDADIARLCQRAENIYVGAPCGIMDQFVVTAAVEGHALLLNTKDLSFELLPMDKGALAECSIVIVNSGIRHSVGDGVYGQRRLEVEEGQAAVVARFPFVHNLGEASLAHLTECGGSMSRASFLRCRHIITEDTRVREAREAMLDGDAERLGQVMTLAHNSYRDDFAASVKGIDFLVESAIGLRGCYGARLTGGGFGGCTVNLVRAVDAIDFSKSVRNAYQKEFGIEAQTYICKAVDGAVARLKKESR